MNLQMYACMEEKTTLITVVDSIISNHPVLSHTEFVLVIPCHHKRPSKLFDFPLAVTKVHFRYDSLKKISTW